MTAVFKARIRLPYRHVAGTLTNQSNGMGRGVTLYPDEERLIFFYNFAKVGGGITVYISVLKVEAKCNSETAVSTYDSDYQPGVQTRTFRGTRKKIE